MVQKPVTSINTVKCTKRSKIVHGRSYISLENTTEDMWHILQQERTSRNTTKTFGNTFQVGGIEHTVICDKAARPAQTGRQRGREGSG